MLRDEVACNGRAMSRRFLNALSHDCQQSNIQQQLEQCLVQWLEDHEYSKYEHFRKPVNTKRCD